MWKKKTSLFTFVVIFAHRVVFVGKLGRDGEGERERLRAISVIDGETGFHGSEVPNKRMGRQNPVTGIFPSWVFRAPSNVQIPPCS